MNKLTLAMIGLSLASVASVSSAITIPVSVYNATNCTVDFSGIAKGWANGGDILSTVTVLGQVLTPTTLSLDLGSASGFAVKAAPTGTLSWYYADASCNQNPTIAFLSCQTDKYGKCTSIKLDCSYICPTCTSPETLNAK